jgi:hypothetical protein
MSSNKQDGRHLAGRREFLRGVGIAACSTPLGLTATGQHAIAGVDDARKGSTGSIPGTWSTR